MARYRFLIVDDEPFTRQIIATALRGLGCNKLGFAQDGREALTAIVDASERTDFILSDFQMPNMNGLELLKSIRMGVRGVDNKIAFGLLTGYSDKEIVGAAFRLDVDCFLTKPVSQAVLEQRLTTVLAEDRVLRDQSYYREVNVRIKKAMSLDVRPKTEIRYDDLPIKVDPSRILDDVALQDVAPGSTLIRDLLTANGEVILRSGQILDNRLLTLLAQLAEIDPTVDGFTIMTPDDT
ncbi:MAG: response regulator [Alphaproteobacteria bacterium]|nr:response regulator [Alphaproteobacteria bacterium]